MMSRMIQSDYLYSGASDAKLHYVLIPGDSDTPLVLIHGQCMCGEDYEKVARKLSENYTLYLIDCFGHGDSEKAPELYRCNIIGDAIADFIRNEIARPCMVSGHSSGGIVAAYVAGVIPGLVKGVLLEDPPFFNVRPGEFEDTFVYRDGFSVVHNFLNQTDETEYLVYNIENGYIFNYLGNHFFGKDWAHNLAAEVKEKLKDSPNTIPDSDKLPAKTFRGFRYMNKFDLLFSESFYTGEWFEGVNQDDILRTVRCPAVYLKAKTKYGKDGILWAANSDESADKVMQLLRNCKRKVVRSGHDIHFEKARYFLKAMRILERML